MHLHHLKPKHLGGTDDPSNLLEVTIEEHALIHEARWYAYGQWQDKVAWLGLSRQIDHEEAIRMVLAASNKRRVEEGTHNFLGPETNKRFSRATQLQRVKEGTHPWLSGEVQRKNAFERVANGTHVSSNILTCPKCGKKGRAPGMYRRHFNNCSV